MSKLCKTCGKTLPPAIARDFTGKPFDLHRCPRSWYVAVEDVHFDESNGVESVRFGDCDVIWDNDVDDGLAEYVEEHHGDWEHPDTVVCYIREHPSSRPDQPWRRFVVSASLEWSFSARERSK